MLCPQLFFLFEYVGHRSLSILSLLYYWFVTVSLRACSLKLNPSVFPVSSMSIETLWKLLLLIHEIGFDTIHFSVATALLLPRTCGFSCLLFAVLPGPFLSFDHFYVKASLVPSKWNSIQVLSVLFRLCRVEEKKREKTLMETNFIF